MFKNNNKNVVIIKTALRKGILPAVDATSYHTSYPLNQQDLINQEK